MAAAVDNPQKLTVVFVPATAYLEQQRLAYFGPFLVPGDDLGFWRTIVTVSLLTLVLVVSAGIFWQKRKQRTALQTQTHGPTPDTPAHSYNE
jgi:type III secretion protein J